MENKYKYEKEKKCVCEKKKTKENKLIKKYKKECTYLNSTYVPILILSNYN